MDKVLAKALENLDWCLDKLREAWGDHYFTEDQERWEVDWVGDVSMADWLTLVEIQRWKDEVMSGR